MSTKELILQELDRVPESELSKVLTYLQALQPPTQEEIDAEFLDVYASVVEKRREVFQRLADA
jgi:hypothetical protein